MPTPPVFRCSQGLPVSWPAFAVSRVNVIYVEMALIVSLEHPGMYAVSRDVSVNSPQT